MEGEARPRRARPTSWRFPMRRLGMACMPAGFCRPGRRLYHPSLVSTSQPSKPWAVIAESTTTARILPVSRVYRPWCPPGAPLAALTSNPTYEPGIYSLNSDRWPGNHFLDLPAVHQTLEGDWLGSLAILGVLSVFLVLPGNQCEDRRWEQLA